MQLGLDYLGLAKFSDEARDAFPKGYALGVFSRTFGDAMKDVKELVKSGKCTALRVQLLWGGDDHKYGDADIPQLTSEAKRWEKFAKDHQGVPVYLSPFCEHKVAQPDPYLKLVKQHAPTCTPVNTPWIDGGGGYSGDFINEVHGTKGEALGKAYIFSYDGSDMLDSDVDLVKIKHQNALFWFGWTENFNGSMAGQKLPIENRKAWPSAKLVQSVRYVMNRMKGVVNLPSNWYWKSHTDGAGANDNRTNKPVLTAPVKAKSADLIRNKKVVASAPYFGTASGGRHRYYFSDWGFEIAHKYGDMPLDLSLGGKVYGQINPAFTTGK